MNSGQLFNSYKQYLYISKVMFEEIDKLGMDATVTDGLRSLIDSKVFSGTLENREPSFIKLCKNLHQVLVGMGMQPSLTHLKASDWPMIEMAM
ncbi:hypothetical protein CGI30_19895 [Vibrio parahaemolyticus]|nr:hypothetical protein CGI30_19895 [Vibrio parahaemolyticus]